MFLKPHNMTSYLSFSRRCTLLLASTIISHGAAANTIGPSRLMLTTQDWPPYQYYEHAEMKGVAITTVKCALGSMSQPYQFTMTSWSDAQMRVQNGNQHGFFVATETLERNEYAAVSTPIAEQKINWYFGAGVEPKITELNKLNLKFSAKFGSNKWFWLKRQGFNVVKQPRDAKVLLKLLKQREIDIALEDQLVFENELDVAGLSKDYFRSQHMETKKMGVYFSNRFLNEYSGFLTSFNRAVEKCKG
ncbi:ABC transporter substrate-binding protein [Vibrio barjaei]|uniref:ABC transporter substrate-binding protein n=2 Tax=Vibrio barjaei TaxID=1676683 RepID=A0ABW7IHC6_9VIBR